MRASQFVSITPFTTTIGALSASLFMKQQQQKQQGKLSISTSPISESVRLPVETRGRGLVDGLGNPTAPHPRSHCPMPSNCQRLLPQQRKCLPCWCSQRNHWKRLANRRPRARAESRAVDDCARDGLVEPSHSIEAPFGAETSFPVSTRGSPSLSSGHREARSQRRACLKTPACAAARGEQDCTRDCVVDLQPSTTPPIGRFDVQSQQRKCLHAGGRWASSSNPLSNARRQSGSVGNGDSGRTNGMGWDDRFGLLSWLWKTEMKPV